jgi:hypothetical protein
MLDELDDLAVPSAEEAYYIVRRAVAEADPDDLRRRAVQNAQAMEVFVLGHEDEPVCRGVHPDLAVASSCESNAADVD